MSTCCSQGFGPPNAPDWAHRHHGAKHFCPTGPLQMPCLESSWVGPLCPGQPLGKAGRLHVLGQGLSSAPRPWGCRPQPQHELEPPVCTRRGPHGGLRQTPKGSLVLALGFLAPTATSSPRPGSELCSFSSLNDSQQSHLCCRPVGLSCLRPPIQPRRPSSRPIASPPL